MSVLGKRNREIEFDALPVSVLRIVMDKYQGEESHWREQFNRCLYMIEMVPCLQLLSTAQHIHGRRTHIRISWRRYCLGDAYCQYVWCVCDLWKDICNGRQLPNYVVRS